MLVKCSIVTKTLVFYNYRKFVYLLWSKIYQWLEMLFLLPETSKLLRSSWKNFQPLMATTPNQNLLVWNVSISRKLFVKFASFHCVTMNLVSTDLGRLFDSYSFAQCRNIRIFTTQILRKIVHFDNFEENWPF